LFKLLFDSRHRVLLTRLSGTYSHDDLVVRDRAVARFVARHGLVRGIMDFTTVEAIDVPIERLVRRAHEPPQLPGQARVIVAPGGVAYEMNRVMVAHQLYSRKVEPVLVRTLEEAYRALHIEDPTFEEVETDEADRLDDSMASVLSRIDEARAAGPVSAAKRQQLREKLLRLFDAVPDRPLPDRKNPPTPRHRTSAITLSDVLNAALNRAALSDSDLTVACMQCNRPMPLSAFTLMAGRETRYACTDCHRVLVTLSPASTAQAPLAAHSYRLGDFIVSTNVDIDCPGARLPRSA
jgi:hypothetical protein